MSLFDRLAHKSNRRILLIRFVFFAVVLGALSAQGFAQAVPKVRKDNALNFSGTWRLHKESERSGTFPKRREDEAKPVPEVELIITQSGESITVKETNKRASNPASKESIYYVDGRGETNKGYDERFTYESRTKLEGRKVIIEMIRRISGVKNTNYVREEWELDPDGKTLTIKNRSHFTKETYRTNSGMHSSLVGYDRVYKLVS